MVGILILKTKLAEIRIMLYFILNKCELKVLKY